MIEGSQMAPLDSFSIYLDRQKSLSRRTDRSHVPIRNQFTQVVAGAAQLGAHDVTAGAAQLGAHEVVPQVLPQKFGLCKRIFGKQSFGNRILWQRGAQPQLETGAQVEATGAQDVATGAQVATGAAQEGAHAAAAGAAQVGAAATHAAGAAQLGAELQLLQLLWWNRPA